HVDGGKAPATNADVAKGHEKTVVVAVTLGQGEISEAMMKPLEAETQVLNDAGGEVTLITPDAASVAAFGANLMNPRHRPAAAKAGLAQGRTMAAEVKGFWG